MIRFRAILRVTRLSRVSVAAIVLVCLHRFHSANTKKKLFFFFSLVVNYRYKTSR